MQPSTLRRVPCDLGAWAEQLGAYANTVAYTELVPISMPLSATDEGNGTLLREAMDDDSRITTVSMLSVSFGEYAYADPR